MSPDLYQRVSDLFLQACELSPAEQSELLAERCGQDAELRRHVELMLGKDQANSVLEPISVLRQLPRLAAGGQGDVDRSPEATLQPSPDQAARPQHPPSIEGFTIMEPLGEGGMGVVYRAIQHSTRRTVAIKTLWQSRYCTDKYRRRFEREVELAASLEHPNIARIYDSGQSDGVPWFAMELIEGTQFDTFVERQAMEQRDKLQLMLGICDAVAYAHRRGIIHRDLKPQNILVTPEGKPYIVDFGLARLLEADLRTDTQLSIAGELLGTPGYMSPEQARGDGHVTDTRSDCYSLGVILFWLLTGKHPVNLTGSLLTVMKRIAENEPLTPKQLGVQVDRDLESLLLKATARLPEHRYQSADELAADLHAFLNGEPLIARSRSIDYLFQKWIIKHRSALALVSTAAVALVAAVLFYFSAIKNEQQRTIEAQNEALRRADDMQELIARNTFAHGIELCDQNEMARGMAELQRALEYTKEEQSGLKTAIRLNLAAWQHEVWETTALLRHSATVQNLCFSGDGRKLLVTTSNSARLWDTNSGQPIGSPLSHGYLIQHATIWSGCFSPDNRMVLTSGTDGRARLWEAETGRLKSVDFKHYNPVAVLNGDTDVWDAQFSPDGATVLTAGGDGLIRLWDTETGKLKGQPMRHSQGLHTAKFHPLGDWIAAGSRDGMVHRWSVANQEPIAEPLNSNPDFWVNSVGFNHDGRLLFSTSHDGRIRLWRTDSGERIVESVPDTREVREAAFNPHDELLYMLTTRGEVQRWNPNAFPALRPSPGVPGEMTSMAVHGPSHQVAVGDNEGTVRVLRIPRGHDTYQCIVSNLPVTAVALEKNEQTVWVASGSQQLWQWDITQRPPIAIQQHTLDINADSLALHPDGSTLAVAAYGGSQLLDLSSGDFRESALASEVFYGPELTQATAYSDDGQRFACGARNGKVRIWDMASSELLAVFHCQASVHAMCFAAANQQLITASADGLVRVWTLDDPKKEPLVLQHPDAVLSMDLSRDEARLVTGCRDGLTRLWDLGKQTVLLPDFPQAHPVSAVVFHPSERFIVTGCRDGAVRTWDVASGFQIGPTFRHKARVCALRLMKDGTELLSASQDRSLRIWRFPVVPDSTLAE